MEGREREVLYYTIESGARPFREWRNAGVPNDDAKAAVDARIGRFRRGSFGDSKPIGDGASESRIDLGPGYRIYYGIDGENIILLCEGDKSTQAADIKRAREHWANYQEREKERKARLAAAKAQKNAGLQRRPSRRPET